MGIKSECNRLQKPEVEHLGTHRLYWKPEKLSIAKIVCHIWYSPVLLLLFIVDLLRLFISTVVGSVSSFSGETIVTAIVSAVYNVETLNWNRLLLCWVSRGGARRHVLRHR